MRPSPNDHVDHIFGLDLGQSQDFSALVMVERRRPVAGGPASYGCDFLHRWKLQTPYRQIVADVAHIVRQPPAGRPGGAPPWLIVDQTGVGAAVVELFGPAHVQAQLRAVHITGGAAVTSGEGGVIRVPKKDLVGAIQVVMQSRRLRAASHPDLDVLLRELATFRTKITVAGNETFEAWRERDHDDMVLAAALAIWWGEDAPPVDGPGPQWHEPSHGGERPDGPVGGYAMDRRGGDLLSGTPWDILGLSSGWARHHDGRHHG
jgi:hypothetical protein